VVPGGEWAASGTDPGEAGIHIHRDGVWVWRG